MAGLEFARLQPKGDQPDSREFVELGVRIEGALNASAASLRTAKNGGARQTVLQAAILRRLTLGL